MERHPLLLSAGRPGAGLPFRRPAVATGRPAASAAHLESRPASRAALDRAAFSIPRPFCGPSSPRRAFATTRRSRSSAISRCCRRGRGRAAGASATTSTPPCGRTSSTTGWPTGSAARSARGCAAARARALPCGRVGRLHVALGGALGRGAVRDPVIEGSRDPPRRQSRRADLAPAHRRAAAALTLCAWASSARTGAGRGCPSCCGSPRSSRDADRRARGGARPARGGSALASSAGTRGLRRQGARFAALRAAGAFVPLRLSVLFGRSLRHRQSGMPAARCTGPRQPGRRHPRHGQGRARLPVRARLLRPRSRRSAAVVRARSAGVSRPAPARRRAAGEFSWRRTVGEFIALWQGAEHLAA